MSHTFTPEEVIAAARAAYAYRQTDPHTWPDNKLDWSELYPEERFWWIGMVHRTLDAITMIRAAREQEAARGAVGHPSNFHG